MTAQQCDRRKCIVITIAILVPLAARGQHDAGAPTITPLNPETRAAMIGKSWNPGCPVSLDDLAAVRVTYLGFDHLTHQGTLVVHKRFSDDALAIFKELYAIRFPINRVDPYENYKPGGENAERDVTVGFYCRKADDAPTEWSGHA